MSQHAPLLSFFAAPFSCSAPFACAAVVVSLALAGCGPAEEPALDLVQIPAPQALSACDNPPQMDAELWVSGVESSCPLSVDASGAASGTCPGVPARNVRTFTVDWFVNQSFAGSTTRVLVAQAQRTLDLTAPESAEVALEFSSEDIVVRGCVDVTGNNKVDGEPTLLFNGVMVPPCDLDESCADAADEACSNLGEVCALGDPLDPAL